MDNKSITYSIIIPHKDKNVTLLTRCLCSIPDDARIQIIVIDDNSQLEKEVFNSLPQFHKAQMDLVFCLQNKGAGNARNLGLEKAEGEWLLFVDADDYFTPNAFNYLFEWAVSNCDIVFFDIDLSENRKGHPYTNYVNDYTGDEKTTIDLKYKTWTPWARMFRTSFILKNNIRFESRIVGNDCFFVLNACHLAQDLKVFKHKLYAYTYNENGLTHAHNTNLNFDLEHMKLFIWRSKFYKKNKLNWLNVGAGIYSHLGKIYRKYGPINELKALWCAIHNKADFVNPLIWKITKK